MSELLQPEALISLLTLTALELVLGIDNVIFLSILTNRLPPTQRATARRIGLIGAMVMRIGLLLAISWVMRLTNPLFHLFGHGFSGRDLILLGGGLFLVGKSTHEIFAKLELGGGHGRENGTEARAPSFGPTLVQVMILDIVFSLDSVITAVGMARHIEIMVIAVVLSIGVMMFFARPIGDFIERHPSMKILALSFLLLLGVLLMADGMGRHLDKGYVYFAMAFALLIELIDMQVRKRAARRGAPGAGVPEASMPRLPRDSLPA